MKNLRNLLAKIDKELDGISYTANDRNNFSAALFDVAIEHSKGIVVLFENSLYASGYALARPIFESFIRAAWLQFCASDEQVAQVKKKDEFPLSLGQMLEAVETTRSWPCTLSNIKDIALKNMHSYTHGGMQLVARRFKNGELIHAIDSGEIDEVTKFVSLITFLSFNNIVILAKNNDKDDFIKEIYEDICKWCFRKKRTVKL